MKTNASSENAQRLVSRIFEQGKPKGMKGHVPNTLGAWKRLWTRKLALCCGLVMSSLAAAQEYPTKPVRVVVSQGPGSFTDIVLRSVTPSMTKALGQALIVENRPGASGMIAFEHVGRQAPADGYTILMGDPGLTTNHLFIKDMRYDAQKDLPPVTILAESTRVLEAPVAVPFNSFAEMLAYAKANPGKLNSGVFGMQSAEALMTYMINLKFGTNVVVIPYKGGAAEIRPALHAGDVHLWFTVEALAIADREKVKVLGMSGARRGASFPNAPTFAEIGLGDIPSVLLPIAVRGGTPKAIVDRIYAAAKTALESPETKAAYVKLNVTSSIPTPEATAKILADISQTFAEVAKKAGIKPE
jgi:tripartite-type tricarboxylate transporter receptor subunit TctC